MIININSKPSVKFMMSPYKTTYFPFNHKIFTQVPTFELSIELAKLSSELKT